MTPETDFVAVVGGGPAGLMAAETIAAAGVPVVVYDAMPSVGRKFLLAGRGGLNLTHAEPAEAFGARFAERSAALAPALSAFGQQAVTDWANGLGIETFVGSSQRVFPVGMKASPLLRAWLRRLDGLGVRFEPRHRWQGWADDGSLRFATPQGGVQVASPGGLPVNVQGDAAAVVVAPRATVLALGGASWPRLGSDGAWVAVLEARGVPVNPLRPANCGFDVQAAPAQVADAPASRREFLKALVGRDAVADAAAAAGWSPHFSSRYAGQPVKPVAASIRLEDGQVLRRRGEFMVTDTGVEGSLVYHFAAALRDEIDRAGSATLWLDLLPDHSLAQVHAAVTHPRGARSLASHLQSRLGLGGVRRALLHELLRQEQLADPTQLADAIKALPLVLAAPRPVAEAISTAGGVPFETLDGHGMLALLPGTFCAGEMLDWEAPTGGYLLTACLASGRAAGAGVLHYLAH